MAFADSIRTANPLMDDVADLLDQLRAYQDWQTWTPTLSGFSANPTNTMYRYRRDATGVWVAVRQSVAGTSNSTGFTISAPVAAAAVTNGYWGTVCWQAYDNGAPINNVTAIIPTGSSTITLSPSSGSWTGSGGKMASFVLFYEV